MSLHKSRLQRLAGILKEQNDNSTNYLLETVLNEQASGNKIFLVFHEGDLDPQQFAGVFSSLENAKQFIAEMIEEQGKYVTSKDWEIYQQTLNSQVEYDTVFTYIHGKDEPYWK